MSAGHHSTPIGSLVVLPAIVLWSQLVSEVRGGVMMNSPTTPTRHTACVALAVAAYLVVLPLAEAWGEAAGVAEMWVADEQAALAATAQQLVAIRLNLQRALNCLEGPKGEDYRAVSGDACTGSAGAEHDLPAGSVNRIRVYKAIRLGAVGITFHDFKPTHYTALAMQAILDEGAR